jgi:acyl-coenzyme A thioesterase PaaI-like protein
MSDAAALRAAVMAQLDAAMVDAALRSTAFACEVATIDLHIVFLQAPEGAVSATARVCGGGRSVQFCEAEATDDAGRAVAKAMGTLRLRPC